ncbi:hypothetical protein SRHO_G00100550 [Serrasalmus rhombeus]
MCEAYKAYFGMPVGDHDKPWAPHFTCEHCKKTLEGWYRGEKRAMHFAVPRIWREPTDHSTNCYFCMVDLSKRLTGKNATPVTQSNTTFRRKQQVRHPDEFSSCADEERKPYYPNQKDLNDLIRDLGLTKSNAELLTSRLKQWNLLDKSVQVTGQRKRHQVFSTFFSHQDGLCFCNNMAGLFEAIGITCNPNEWRLFIDSSCKSLKAVLLHNGNKYPSLPVAHSVHLKEEYTSVKMLLGALNYDEYGWEVIGDFKMVSFLMGLQGGFTKCHHWPCCYPSCPQEVTLAPVLALTHLHLICN